MNPPRFTVKESIFLGVFLLLSFVFWFRFDSGIGGTDTYLFRDAAVNAAQGRGFVTASFEHAHSFHPLLYSNYTPASQWPYQLVVTLFGCSPATDLTYSILLSLFATGLCLLLIARCVPAGRTRWILLALTACNLPFGCLLCGQNRPEEIALPLLVLILWLIRRPPTWSRAALAGFLGGLAFLVQPFAGVFCVLLLAGWALLTLQPTDRSLRSLAPSLVRNAAMGLLSALLFAVPLAITAQAFHQRDPDSLHRFWLQATQAGLERQASYSAGETAATKPASPAARTNKYAEALRFHIGLGPLALANTAVSWLFALVAVALLVTRNAWHARLYFALCALACFGLPLLLFPLQGNYLLLTRLLFLFMLAFPLTILPASAAPKRFLIALLALHLVGCLPLTAIGVLQQAETRRSFTYAQGQAEALRNYFSLHPLGDRVVLVPSSHYFLYKSAAQNLYNPTYLSVAEDPEQVGAVVNCYNGSKNFEPGTLPLPDFVSGQAWTRISQARQAVPITLFGHRLMSRNWAMDCDLYVRADRP